MPNLDEYSFSMGVHARQNVTLYGDGESWIDYDSVDEIDQNLTLTIYHDASKQHVDTIDVKGLDDAEIVAKAMEAINVWEKDLPK